MGTILMLTGIAVMVETAWPFQYQPVVGAVLFVVGLVVSLVR